MRVGLILTEALGGLRRNISMVISVVLVTFVSLTFVGAAILMQGQISTMRAYWTERAQVSVSMCSTVSTGESCIDGVATPDQVDQVRAELESDPLASLIGDLRFETKAEAYANITELLGEEQASVLTEEQMSETFYVTLKDPGQSQAMSTSRMGIRASGSW